MYNSYKDQYNEWAYNFQQDNGRDPSIEEAKECQSEWLDNLYHLVDIERKKQKENEE